MSRECIVLGAGMVGVSVAYHAARRGRAVTLVDRSAPGRETSFGNAGIIQREAVEPYPFPHDAATLLRVLPNRSVDIRYRLTATLAAAGPLAAYWWHSSQRRYARIVPEYASLIALATETHGAMIEAANAQSLVHRNGWLEIYRTPGALEMREAAARPLESRYGVRFESLGRDDLARLEPDLSPEAVGAIRWLDSWTVDSPGELAQAYGRALEAEGGRLVKAEIKGIEANGAGWRVTTGDGVMEAGDVVVALGPWAGPWLARLGCRLPLFTKRGYHMHYSSRHGKTLGNWLLDAEVGYLLAPMSAGIRLTTGAELAQLDAPPDLGQLDAAEAAARTLFPLDRRVDDSAWLGARPCLPDMKPVIGPAPGRRGLWLAVGHGHQGFTLGPATGDLLARMMDDEPLPIDMKPFRAERFGGAG